MNHGLSEKTTEMVLGEIFDAEFRGRSTHGIMFMPRIVREIKEKKSRIKVVRQNACSALVDGGDNLGATVSHFCAHLAIEKAKNQNTST